MSKLNIILTTIAGLLASLSLFIAATKDLPNGPAFGGAPQGTNVGSTSLLSYYYGEVSASGTVGILYETKKSCASRVITTASSSIRIGMSSTTPSANSGVLQVASSTVAYDGEIYGCGMWSVYGYSVPGTAVGAHTISILEFN